MNKIRIRSIEQYIKDYEEGNVTVEKIAKNEGISKTTIDRRINEYYYKNGKERPKQRNVSNKIPIDIKQYIKDYEKGNITVEKIAKNEGVSRTTIDRRINEYYYKKRKGKN